MNVHITNTPSWVKVDGKVAKPNFKRETLIWRGSGDDVHLIGFDHATGDDNVVDWTNPPDWALTALQDAGVTLPHGLVFEAGELPEGANAVMNATGEDEPLEVDFDDSEED